MNKKHLIALVLVVLTVGFIGYIQLVKPQLENRTITDAVSMKIQPTDLPLFFTYPSGQNALALIEPPVTDGDTSILKKVYLLMDNKDYNQYLSQEDGEVPPTISVFAVAYEPSLTLPEDSSRVEKLQNWAESNPQFSSWPAHTSEAQTLTIDGVTAIRYTTESVYTQKVYIALYDKTIFIFTAQDQVNSQVIADGFAQLIGSIAFD